MAAEPRKLTAGEILDVDALLGYLPFLKELLDSKELNRSQLSNFAAGAAALRKFRKGDVVCREGDFGSTAFFVVKGKLEVSILNPLAHVEGRARGFFRRNVARITSFLVRRQPDPADTRGFIPIDAAVDLPRSRPIAEIREGEIFGEMTCRTFQPRSATVTVMEDCVLVEMLRVVLDMLVGTRTISGEQKKGGVKAATFKGSPTFRAQMDKIYRTRSLLNQLRSVPVFAALPDDYVREVAEKVELVSAMGGDVICKQGELADAFYLIRSGMVKVSETMPGGELVRTYLSKGDYFGEVGLVRPDGLRVANCTALDAVDLVKIPKPQFEEIVQRFPRIAEEFQQVADARSRITGVMRAPAELNLDEYLGQGLFEAQNLLLIDLDKCTRCDACVTACAEAHDGVTRLLRDGLRYDRYLVATACRSCHDPLCMTQCPVGSIRRKESLEIIIEDWCIGCKKCAELCPYGNINMHPVESTKIVEEPVKGKPESGNRKPERAEAKPPAVEKAPKAEAVSKAPKAAAPEAKPEAAEKPVAKAAEPKAAPVKTAEKTAAPEKADVKAEEKTAEKKRKVKKKITTLKATTCDLCSELTTPSCVYACPHDAAMRVDPARYFAGERSGNQRRRSLLERIFFKEEPLNRTTH